MPRRPILIRGGRLIDPSQSIDRTADVLIVDGRVAAIDPGPTDVPEDCEIVTATGRIVAPGLVDILTELREPGFEEDETIRSGGAAALAGGYTTLLVAGNTDPCIDTPGSVEFVRQKAVQADGPRIGVIACVSKNRDGDQMAELGLLHQAGAVAFSDAPRPLANSALLKRALEYCRMLDIVIFDRPGVPELSRGGVMHEGQTSLVLGLKGLPTEGEDLAVARDVRLLEATGGRLHVGPISTMGAIDMIKRVKKRQIPVTASVCPHNLCAVDSLDLCDESLRTFDSEYKVHPPLRSRRHVSALVRAVVDGTIDLIQSGHMPRAREKKMNDLDSAPFGLTALETALSTAVTSLILPGHLNWPRLIELMSTHPANIVDIEAGSLAIGSPADLIVIDPQASWKVEPSNFRSHCISTPLVGRTLTGRVERTMVAGVWKH